MNNLFVTTFLSLVLVFSGFNSCTQNNGSEKVTLIDQSEIQGEVSYRSPASADVADRSSVCGQIEKQASDDSPELKIYVVHYLRGKVLLLPQTEKVALELGDLQEGAEDEAKQICAYGFLREGLEQEASLQVEEIVIMDGAQ